MMSHVTQYRSQRFHNGSQDPLYSGPWFLHWPHLQLHPLLSLPQAPRPPFCLNMPGRLLPQVSVLASSSPWDSLLQDVLMACSLVSFRYLLTRHLLISSFLQPSHPVLPIFIFCFTFLPSDILYVLFVHLLLSSHREYKLIESRGFVRFVHWWISSTQIGTYNILGYNKYLQNE